MYVNNWNACMQILISENFAQRFRREDNDSSLKATTFFFMTHTTLCIIILCIINAVHYQRCALPCCALLIKMMRWYTCVIIGIIHRYVHKRVPVNTEIMIAINICLPFILMSRPIHIDTIHAWCATIVDYKCLTWDDMQTNDLWLIYSAACACAL